MPKLSAKLRQTIADFAPRSLHVRVATEAIYYAACYLSDHCLIPSATCTFQLRLFQEKPGHDSLYPADSHVIMQDVCQGTP